ncbi:MAG TPA: hypothetical protein VFS43_00990 [Polyangiaceae bacterium]|nr:hypothetical protein [Polyangiaceae bacterium]
MVEALYDPEAANEQTLTNLLARKGYAGLEALRQALKQTRRWPQNEAPD